MISYHVFSFVLGKSRSIAIPENRIAAEERKKQRVTKEKLSELKRHLNAEGEDISRKMRQCHMNLTLSAQQSDATKTIHLREEMQRLNQHQAKLHFRMDDLLAKERKLSMAYVSNNAITDPNQVYFHPTDLNNNFTYVHGGNIVSQVPIISPQSQVHVDEHGRVLEITNNIVPMVRYDGDNVYNDKKLSVMNSTM